MNEYEYLITFDKHTAMTYLPGLCGCKSIFSCRVFRFSSLSKSIVYADDTTVIIRGNTISEAVQKANIILEQYYNFFTNNKLTLNESKTKYMIFAKKNKRVNTNQDIIKINGVAIEQVKSIKFLGLIINENLNWNEHKLHVKQKIQRSCVF